MAAHASGSRCRFTSLRSGISSRSFLWNVCCRCSLMRRIRPALWRRRRCFPTAWGSCGPATAIGGRIGPGRHEADRLGERQRGDRLRWIRRCGPKKRVLRAGDWRFQALCKGSGSQFRRFPCSAETFCASRSAVSAVAGQRSGKHHAGEEAGCHEGGTASTEALDVSADGLIHVLEYAPFHILHSRMLARCPERLPMLSSAVNGCPRGQCVRPALVCVAADLRVAHRILPDFVMTVIVGVSVYRVAR